MKLSRKVCDVASAYFPAPQKASSTRRLRRWIDSDPTLTRALVRAGYRKGQHAFTPWRWRRHNPFMVEVCESKSTVSLRSRVISLEFIDF